MPGLRITVTGTPAAEASTPLLVLPHFEREGSPTGPGARAVDGRLGGALARVLEAGDFRGRQYEALVLYPRDGELPAERVLLVGLGKADRYTAETLRRAAGTAVRQAERLGVRELAFDLGHVAGASERLGGYHAGRAAAEGLVLAAWEFREFRGEREGEPPRAPLEAAAVVADGAGEPAEVRRGVQDGTVGAEGENLARELAARPGNAATPTFLAETARRLADETGMRATVLDRDALRAEGMHALLAVARGSEEEPRFIVLEYRGADEGEPPLVLIGKGVTFDAGGISLKPAEKMEDMKYDMSGAAAVLGAMQAIARLKLVANVVALIPATENLPSGRALKPGDVIRSHLGKTIEVINTDAEGRLILADALSYARRFAPRAVLDAATLTGACVVALGHHAIGLMGNDGALQDEVRAAGQRVGQRCWPLPLWDEYREQLDSDVADLKNTGGRPAGTITAGWFLKEFAGDVPWAHLDIAGVAYRDQVPPYLRKGPTGSPTRLFVEWVRARSERG